MFRWDTIKGAWTQSVYYGEHRHLIGQLYPTETFRSSGADADAKSPHLLAVDALDLSHGDGYHGTLAATVETVHGCTYRIVHDHSVGGEGRHGVDGINVHVSEGSCFDLPRMQLFSVCGISGCRLSSVGYRNMTGMDSVRKPPVPRWRKTILPTCITFSLRHLPRTRNLALS